MRMVKNNVLVLLIVFVLLILQPAFSFTSFSARAFVSVAGGRSDSIVKGEFVLHSTAGYNWWSYVPTSLSQQDLSYLLLEESHPQLEDYAGLTTTAVYSLLPYRSFAEAHRFILVLVVLPRNFSAGYYSQGINYYSLRSSTPDFYYRPDLKVNAILSEFLAALSAAGYHVCEQVFVAGFSAGGMWANRYTLLHPERVKASAIGHSGGWLAVPFAAYNGTTLNWPLGINDFPSLTGEQYTKLELLKHVPQFIFIGDQDNSNTYHSDPYPSLSEIEIWGATDPERLENQCHFLEHAGFSVEFQLYLGVAHSYTSEMLDDVITFFVSVAMIDTDADGLTDDEEVFLYLTDPHNNDTDSDGFLDGDEVVNGTDPLDPDDFPSSPPATDTAVGLSVVGGFGFFACAVILIELISGLKKRDKPEMFS